MNISKARFVEPGNRPYRKSLKNLYVYDRYIRNPSIGLLTLATIVKAEIEDTFMYSESISKVKWDDVFGADIVFIGIFTFNAVRGYEIARLVKENSGAVVVMGGLHASLNYREAAEHCDYVLLGEGDESILELIDALGSGKEIDFPGVAYLKDGGKNGELVNTGKRGHPRNTDVIPNRSLVYRYKEMAGHNTLWPQIHASRGCPHNCDYCAVVSHLGREVRTRTPQNVVEDIRQAIEFHDKRAFPRINRIAWLTDDNFFADRAWAMSVLNTIIGSGIKYKFSVQARCEVGLDDEMLVLLKRAGFAELAFGIEFLDDESFRAYHKNSSYDEIVRAIRNTQKHGLNVRGLFILGSDAHAEGIGDRIADFVEVHGICGVLLQSMYFTPGTPVYDSGKDALLHEDWSKYNGNVVHHPKRISAYALQLEIIRASARIYSRKRLLRALFSFGKLSEGKRVDKVLFLGEYFWHKSIRSDLKRELPYLQGEGMLISVACED